MSGDPGARSEIAVVTSRPIERTAIYFCLYTARAFLATTVKRDSSVAATALAAGVLILIGIPLGAA